MLRWGCEPDVKPVRVKTGSVPPTILLVRRILLEAALMRTLKLFLNSSPRVCWRRSMASMSSAKGTLAPASVLAESWSIAAEGYNELFVPRFKPWTDNAIALLGSAEFKLPAGDVLVPTCGPGQELPRVADSLDKNVRGTDLAPGMIEVAQRRCEGNARLSCAVEDAMAPTGEYAALLSVFGLQQLPDQAQAIQAWTRCLKLGGVGVVVYWPVGAGVELQGPWAHWGRILRAMLGNSARRGVPGWEDSLSSAVEAAGGEVLFESKLKYRIEWPSPSFMFDAMTECGPWHALRLKKGDGFVDGLRDEFLAPYAPEAPLVHDPEARVLCFRRTS